MNDKRKLKSDELAKIETLVESATNAVNKKSAAPYIKQLESIRYKTELTPYVNGVFGELISYVKEASGRVREKDHWTRVAYETLYRLLSFL